MEHECSTCGYVYEKKPQKVPFDDLPETWRCPICNVLKKNFIAKDRQAKQPK